jgi:threonine dehydrogenase-like Zn-dependent dehydrogenase
LDKLRPPVGAECLLIGAGPTGLILAQLLKLNGASKVVLAANKGIKMDIARKIDAADEYIEASQTVHSVLVGLLIGADRPFPCLVRWFVFFGYM